MLNILRDAHQRHPAATYLEVRFPGATEEEQRCGWTGRALRTKFVNSLRPPTTPPAAPHPSVRRPQAALLFLDMLTTHVRNACEMLFYRTCWVEDVIRHREALEAAQQLTSLRDGSEEEGAAGNGAGGAGGRPGGEAGAAAAGGSGGGKAGGGSSGFSVWAYYKGIVPEWSGPISTFVKKNPPPEQAGPRGSSRPAGWGQQTGLSAEPLARPAAGAAAVAAAAAALAAAEPVAAKRAATDEAEPAQAAL